MNTKRALELLDDIEASTIEGTRGEAWTRTAVAELRELLKPDMSDHEHGYTYLVEFSGSAGMTLGPRELHEADDSKEWLESLADNLKEWVAWVTVDDLAQRIERVDLINTECFSHGAECPDTGASENDVYVSRSASA